MIQCGPSGGVAACDERSGKKRKCLLQMLNLLFRLLWVIEFSHRSQPKNDVLITHGPCNVLDFINLQFFFQINRCNHSQGLPNFAIEFSKFEYIIIERLDIRKFEFEE